MNHTEHPAKTPTINTGLFATLRALLRAKGSGAPSLSPAQGSAAPSACLALTALLATSAALALTAAPASAAQTHFFLSTFNGSGEAPAALEGPEGLAVDNSTTATEGDVYVADSGHAVIDRFDAAGHYLSQIDGTETLQKSFAPGFPWNLAVDPANGDLYVTDAGHGVLDKFDNTGKVLAGFGTEGQISTANVEEGALGSPSAGNPFSPTSLAVDPASGDLYVGDASNNVIDVFDSTGVYLRQFASSGPPYSLALDSQGNLFLADGYSGGTTEVYVAASGALNPAYGEGSGRLDSGLSFAVAVDPSTDDVYVDHGFEGSASSVVQYDKTGKLVLSFGSGHVGEDFGGLAIGKANSHVYVAAFRNNDVEAFGPQLTVAETTTEAATEVTPISATLNGTVNPAGLELSECRFEYGATEAYGHTVPCEESSAQIGSGTEAVEVHAKVGLALGPGASAHFRLLAPDANGPAVGSADQAILIPAVETESVHGLVGENIVLYGGVNSNGTDTHYHFEYVSEVQFKESEWAKATSSPERDAGGNGERVWEEISGLEPGATYHFRISAKGADAPGDPQSSPDRTVAVPAPAKPGPEEPCPNQATRSGPSANLPDCRAYEQLTPAEKGGAQDISGPNGETPAQVGQDGEHLLLYNLKAKWGENTNPGADNNYAFSRTPAGWQMTPTTPQPQAGIFNYVLQNFETSGLSQLLFSRYWQVSAFSQSSTADLVIGPPGGPYTTVATVPTAYGASHAQWIAQSRDGAVAVLGTDVRELIPGHPTPTTEGNDLYEYSQGQLSQLNVSTNGETIGTCGANLTAVSENGSHVFFTDNCTGHLHMRVDGAETVDLGEYGYVGANPAGTRLILHQGSEYFLYHTETQTFEHLPKLDGLGSVRAVSEDGNVIYLGYIEEGLPSYFMRYEISTEKLTFLDNFVAGKQLTGGFSASPDGRFFYWESGIVEGFPSGSEQLYRYDSAEEAIQCISCASPFNPAPKSTSVNITDGQASAWQSGGPPEHGSPGSANGDYVFFDTISALVPQDVNGEVPPEGLIAQYSSSSDVYEWRRNGIGGCTHVQGCIALITNGIDGGRNELLGTTSGRDVFFISHSRLVATDGDTVTDVYDARIGGGYPPPPRSVQCEGDACSTPVPAPNDPTPGTLTNHGPGNEHPTRKHKKHHHRRKHHKRSGAKHGGGK